MGYITARTFVLTMGTRSDLDEVAMSPAISALGHDGVSPANTTRSSASPRPGMDFQDILRSSARTTFCDPRTPTAGLHLAARGGKQARNKAVVAIARKLAVLLHRIWVMLNHTYLSTPRQLEA